MTAIAEAAGRRYAAGASLLDRAEFMGPLFIAPAILYVVLLVGVAVPAGDLLQRQRLYDLQSELSLRRAEEPARGARKATSSGIRSATPSSSPSSRRSSACCSARSAPCC